MKKIIFILFFSCLAWLAMAQDFSVSPLSDSLFASMQGLSYPTDCPVPRSALRHVRVMHVDAQGKVHRGDIVCNKAIADDLVDIFRELYQAKYPIERIRPIDEYGADDERSMRANNSSSFCYRTVPGSQNLSKHAKGMAIDINTLYNPYVKKGRDGRVKVLPETAEPYTDRRRLFPYKIRKGDLLYRLFIQHGFKWGGNWHSLKDYQHFEK